MCIIAVTPAGMKLTDETIGHCWTNNPHGGGFAYVDNSDTVRVFATLDKQEFLDAFHNAAGKYARTSPMLSHFRIKTHGEKSLDNCHPFKVNSNLVFAHNGIIDIPIPDDMRKMSDTSVFNDLVLKKLPKDFVLQWALRDLIRKYIGYSKLVFLDKTRRVTFINKNLGVTDGECWFSNETFKETVYSDYKYSKKKWERQGADAAIMQKPIDELTPQDWSTMNNAQWIERREEYNEKFNPANLQKAEPKIIKRVPYQQCELCQDTFYGGVHMSYIASINMLVCEDCQQATINPTDSAKPIDTNVAPEVTEPVLITSEIAADLMDSIVELKEAEKRLMDASKVS